MLRIAIACFSVLFFISCGNDESHSLDLSPDHIKPVQAPDHIKSDQADDSEPAFDDENPSPSKKDSISKKLHKPDPSDTYSNKVCSFVNPVSSEEKITRYVACYHYNPEDRFFGQGSGPGKTAWEYAKTFQGEFVKVEGMIVDGFFIVSNIFTQREFAGKKLPLTKRKIIENSRAAIESLCKKRIQQVYPKKNFQLYQIASVISQLKSENYTMVFEKEDHEQEASRLIIFGDSLSDNGNLKGRLRKIPAAPYFLGRFSDGFVWNDYLSQKLNLSVQNWAYGGSLSIAGLSQKIPEIGLISHFISHARLRATGSMDSFVDAFISQNQRLEVPKKTVFVIWIGGNDYISRFDDEQQLNTLIDDPDREIFGANSTLEISTEAVKNNIEKLYKFGARNFLIANLPDLGKTPKIHLTKNYRASDKSMHLTQKQFILSVKLSEFIEKHNHTLKKVVDSLAIKYSDANLAFVDMYTAFNKLMKNIGPNDEEGFDYGFTFDSTSMRLFDEAGQRSPIDLGDLCYSGSLMGTNNYQSELCKNSHQFIFWDQIHPTTKAHCVLAYQFQMVMFKAKMIQQKPDFADYRKYCKLGSK
jgi:thermolabile hemolysin